MSRLGGMVIISHKYKFIFLKTNKTAGTSIEIALSKFCGPDDIITPISLEDEKTRSRLGYLGPQNYLAPFSDYTFSDWSRFLRKGVRKKRFRNHISAQGVKQYINQEVWDSYYKFCFERNPWDRLISLYYWQCKSDPRPTIAEFIASGALLGLKRSGYNLYTINGQVVVDRICRFESLNEELEKIRTQLGIPEKLELPHAKSRYRQDKRSYREILNEKERAEIAELFYNEIKLLNYEF